MGSKNKKNKKSSKVITDERFAQSQKDPRFQAVSRHKTKVAIDSRKKDKRGKSKKDGDSSQSALKNYNRMDNEEHKQKKQPQKSKSKSKSETESSGEEEDFMDDHTSTDTNEEDIKKETTAKKVEKKVPKTETHRLAIVNLDWSQVQAVDLFVVLSSCLPIRGEIMSVSVYPSKIGLKKMKEGKFRDYESNRLRCDGFQFASSSNILDLSFIPDSMEFKHAPRDVATEAPANYEGIKVGW